MYTVRTIAPNTEHFQLTLEHCTLSAPITVQQYWNLLLNLLPSSFVSNKQTRVLATHWRTVKMKLPDCPTPEPEPRDQKKNGCSATYGGPSHQPADRQISAQKLYFVLTQRPRAVTSQLASCPLRPRTAASPLGCATLQHRSTRITVFLPIAWFCHLARGTIRQFQEVLPSCRAACQSEMRHRSATVRAPTVASEPSALSELMTLIS